eukprot:1933746-Amphidinium_carterae.1
MATKIVMMGPLSDNVPIQQLIQYAVRLLGLMAERVSEEKGTKQILNHTANAAGASDTGQPCYRLPRAMLVGRLCAKHVQTVS